MTWLNSMLKNLKCSNSWKRVITGCGWDFSSASWAPSPVLDVLALTFRRCTGGPTPVFLKWVSEAQSGVYVSSHRDVFSTLSCASVVFLQAYSRQSVYIDGLSSCIINRTENSTSRSSCKSCFKLIIVPFRGSSYTALISDNWGTE